jgi:uncharacterized protein
MSDLRFAWDQRKAQANLAKHGVSFDEAQTVFLDDHALVIADPDHSSDEEERFVMLGMSALRRTLVVCHCFRERDDVIRLISARTATRKERASYAAKGTR